MSDILEATDFSLNNIQKAVAVACYELLKGKQARVIVEMPPSSGKSRVIAAIVAMAIKLGKFASIKLVFSSQFLLEYERDSYDRLLGVYKGAHQCNVELVSLKKGATLGADADSVVIVDEADAVLLDQEVVLAAPFVIGLTATGFSDKEVGGQDVYLFKGLGCKYLKTRLRSNIDTEKVQQTQFGEFISETIGMAHLMYLSDLD